MAQLYLITNRINGKFYIGQTKRTYQERWYNHTKSAKGKGKDCPALYNAIRKYGEAAFEASLLCEVDEHELDTAEMFMIAILGAKFGYNIDRGGRGRTRYSHSSKSRRKMSNTRKEMWKTLEYREQMSKAHLGQKAWNKGIPSTQSRESLSKRARGNNGWRIREARKRGFM